MTSRDAVIAYRQLYKTGLRAVQYAKPQRYTVRDRLRQEFRNKNGQAFDQAKIDRTVEFLDGAARVKGLEHKILKSLLHTWWYRDRPNELSKTSSAKNMKEFQHLNRSSYDHFDQVLYLLNESMGTCLR